MDALLRKLHIKDNNLSQKIAAFQTIYEMAENHSTNKSNQLNLERFCNSKRSFDVNHRLFNSLREKFKYSQNSTLIKYE